MGEYQKTKYPGIFKYVGPKGEIYGVDFYAGGKRHRETVGDRLKDAQDELAKRRKMGRKGAYISQAKKRKMTIEDLAGTYRGLKGGNGYFQKTEGLYLGMIEIYFKDRRVAEITPLDIQEFKKARMEQKSKNGGARGNASVNRELGLLRHLLNQAVLWRMIEANPFDEFRRQVKAGRTEKVFLSEPKRHRCIEEGEFQRIMAEASPYLRNIVLGCLYTRLRVRDLLALRWDDVDWEKMTISFRERKKGDKKGRKPMTKDLADLLNNIPRDDGGFIFLGHKGKPINAPPRGFRRLCDKLGIRDLQLKDLRRSGATMLMERGAPLPVIQADLGHTKVSTTELYLHVRDKLMRSELEKGDGCYIPAGGLTGQKLGRNELSEDTPVAGNA